MEHRLSLSGELPPPWLAERFAGVGLIRSEYLVRGTCQYVTMPGAQQRIAEYVTAVAKIFAPRPVWYRTTELTTPEANTLQGVDRKYTEADFMKGRRGLRRALELPEAFDTELRVVAEVARDHPNVHVLFPFVRDADDLGFGIQALERVNWPTRFGSMVEIPAALLEAGRFIDMGASNLMLGLNDLSALLIGTSRQDGDHKLHPSVWWAVDQLAEAAGGRCEWGMAGNLPPAVLARAEQARPPYVSVHYGELPHLLGVDPQDLPDLDYVDRTKRVTREHIARAEEEELLVRIAARNGD